MEQLPPKLPVQIPATDHMTFSEFLFMLVGYWIGKNWGKNKNNV
jgi:hypothetical protein